MPNGFGRGINYGRGFGGGMGFGFRGNSPAWPYVGRGRGGLPRCGYFVSPAGVPPAWPYQIGPYPYSGIQPGLAYAPFTAPMHKEEELSHLKNEAEAIKSELEQIEARMRSLESQK